MHDINCKKYITETKIAIRSGQTDTNANSVLFVNTGLDPVNVDGLILQPSQSWSIEGNFNEINIKTYSYIFQNISSPQQLTIILKRYVN